MKHKFRLPNFDTHIAFRHYDKIEKICKTLFKQSPITYFCYQRFYRDGSYTFLPTHSDLGNYFYKDAIYPDTWLFNMPFESFQSGICYWDMAKHFSTPRQLEINSVISKHLNLPHGIDIVIKTNNYCDSYCFASKNIEIYLYNLNYLKQFIYYFRQEAYQLLYQARLERFSLPLDFDRNKLIPITVTNTAHDVYMDTFNTKRFYLSGEYEHIYLTRKEMICLQQLSKGMTMKTLAKILALSHKTVARHVENIKDKLNCTQLLEALRIVNESTC